MNNNKLINEKLICAFCWSVLPSSRVTDIHTEGLMEPEVEVLIFSMTVAAVRTIDHHAQEVLMDDEYACSDASDVLYGIMILIFMLFVVLVQKFVVGQEINMLLMNFMVTPCIKQC